MERMTIRITREQYAKDLARIIKPDPLEIDPVEYFEYKELLKQRFMIYVPEDYRDVAFMNTLDSIFDQLVAITPTFTRSDVEESVKRLIIL
jgi:hypothetical protein